jgi:hypothetical protein
MKKRMISLDEKTANLLEKSPNASETIRQALMIYNEDISTDTLAGMRQAFRLLAEQQEKQHEELTNMLFEMNEKLDTITRRATGEYQ